MYTVFFFLAPSLLCVIEASFWDGHKWIMNVAHPVMSSPCQQHLIIVEITIYTRLAVPQSAVGSLVTSIGSRGGRDSFLGVVEDDGFHLPVEKCDIRMERTYSKDPQLTMKDIEF